VDRVSLTDLFYPSSSSSTTWYISQDFYSVLDENVHWSWKIGAAAAAWLLVWNLIYYHFQKHNALVSSGPEKSASATFPTINIIALPFVPNKGGCVKDCVELLAALKSIRPFSAIDGKNEQMCALRIMFS